MATPFRPRTSRQSAGADWRCTCCGKLLGVMDDDVVDIRMARRHEYVASLPVTGTCRDCGTLNRITSAKA